MNYEKIKKVSIKNLKSILNFFPMILSILLLVSLLETTISTETYLKILSNNTFISALKLDLLGSVLAGNTITAYLIGKGFLDSGISLFLITIFILAWVSVGIIQFPAESTTLGKKFAIVRNILAFIFAIIVSGISVFIYNIIIN